MDAARDPRSTAAAVSRPTHSDDGCGPRSPAHQTHLVGPRARACTVGCRHSYLPTWVFAVHDHHCCARPTPRPRPRPLATGFGGSHQAHRHRARGGAAAGGPGALVCPRRRGRSARRCGGMGSGVGRVLRRDLAPWWRIGMPMGGVPPRRLPVRARLRDGGHAPRRGNDRPLGRSAPRSRRWPAAPNGSHTSGPEPSALAALVGGPRHHVAPSLNRCPKRHGRSAHVRYGISGPRPAKTAGNGLEEPGRSQGGSSCPGSPSRADGPLGGGRRGTTCAGT